MKTLARLTLAAALLAPLAAVPAAPAAPAERAAYGSAELDRLLAPIALYPDTVLSQVLVASTYPLEVVAAARWSREHRGLRGQAAVDAAAGMDWDASVRALVAFPELLARMDADLDWTQDLGDAFLGQQAEVMDRVQFLRERAYQSGHLDALEHERVVREREVIYIEPAVSEVVYLPFYDPWVVYGTWWWPAYPPYRWAWWDGHPAAYYAYDGGFYWGVGFRVAPSFYYCHFNWPARQVVVINQYDARYPVYSSREAEHYRGASPWQHDPGHRRGVGYRDARLNQEYHHGYIGHDRGEARGPWTGGAGDSGWRGASWRGGGHANVPAAHEGQGRDRAAVRAGAVAGQRQGGAQVEGGRHWTDPVAPVARGRWPASGDARVRAGDAHARGRGLSAGAARERANPGRERSAAVRENPSFSASASAARPAQVSPHQAEAPGAQRRGQREARGRPER